MYNVKDKLVVGEEVWKQSKGIQGNVSVQFLDQQTFLFYANVVQGHDFHLTNEKTRSNSKHA